MKKRIVLSFILLICFITSLLLPVTVYAAGSNTLRVVFADSENEPFDNATFKIYRVAARDSYGAYQWTQDFEEYQLSLDNLDDNEALLDLASQLDALVTRDKKEADYTDETDDEGTAVFSGLRDGMYLLVGNSFTKSSRTYTPTPTIVFLPGVTVNGRPQYTVTVNPKFTFRSNGGGGFNKDLPITRHVLKVWDDGDAADRPDHVRIELLQDGEFYDSCVLGPDNNWRYTWTDLSSKSNWQVVERVPSGYTASVRLDGTTFVVTNAKPHDTEPPDDDPGKQDPGKEDPGKEDPGKQDPGKEDPGKQDPGTQDPGKTDPGTQDPGTQEPGISDVEQNVPTLPKTGQLWWPVPLLCGAGLVLFIAGMLLKGREDESEN